EIGETEHRDRRFIGQYERGVGFEAAPARYQRVVGETFGTVARSHPFQRRTGARAAIDLERAREQLRVRLGVQRIECDALACRCQRRVGAGGSCALLVEQATMQAAYGFALSVDPQWVPIADCDVEFARVVRSERLF